MASEHGLKISPTNDSLRRVKCVNCTRCRKHRTTESPSQHNHAAFAMSNTRNARVENALQSLLERLVPQQYPNESEEDADNRWEDANLLARDLVNTQAEHDTVEDVNLAADLIRERLSRGGTERRGLERATSFGNLYSRLLAQPVLGQKWGILYFLHRVGEEEQGENHDESRPAHEAYEEMDVDEPEQITRRPSEPKKSYDDAFARDGLPRIPRADGPKSPKAPPVRDRPVPARQKSVSEDKIPQQQQQQNADHDKLTPGEPALLRDLPFTLQGLSSNNLPFQTDLALKLPTNLPTPLVSLLHTLSEPALLYRSLSQFVESSDVGGLVSQSLRSAIGTELRSYLSLVAQLEGQIRRALQQLDVNLPHGGLGKAGVTLKRLVVWTRDATTGLRLMSLIVENAKDKKGGELISLVHTFATSHGDPFVHNFAERLLSDITKPFYNMLRAWIYDGELEDPHQEFFVYENRDDREGMGGGATNVWEHKYALQPAMIPTIMTSDFANRVFLIGKSLNFIRYSCGDSAWVENHSRDASRELSYSDSATLYSSIDSAYSTVMARLLSLMEDKFALFTHLTALKKYLLLGQGDFIALLMESLADNLDQPANSQYRHTLTAQLEHAIRNSNAQHDDVDVLRRLDARMLELSHGEIGWDVFTLEYRIDSPLDVIVTPWASKQYLKVFNFLWRVKRVQFALGITWRKCMTGARGVLGAVGDKLGEDWKMARGAMAEMIHFIDQLQWYILFEVIEAGWEGLQKEIRKPDATLDTLITAHTSYLRAITRKGLLGGGHVDFTTQLHELLKLILAYKDAIDALWSHSVDEFGRRQERAAKIETRTKAGRWGLTEADDDSSASFHGASTNRRGAREGEVDSPIPQLIPLPGGPAAVAGNEGAILDHLRARLRALRGSFKAKIIVLLTELQSQPDTDMRFLGVVMNYNGAYPLPEKKRKGAKVKA
jgi:gamma-tubulin complex component 3